MVDLRTFGRIYVHKTPDEAYDVTQAILQQMKLKIKEKNDETFYIHSKTKLSWLKNKFATDFRILVRPNSDQSVIDIYSDVFTLTGGPDTGDIVDPFYKILANIISDQPKMDVEAIEIKTDEIKDYAGKPITKNNASDSAISVADEIAKLSKLKEDGALSEEEFKKMKDELIDKM